MKSFQKVYISAKDHYNGTGNVPINPIIRHEPEKSQSWILDSDLNPSENDFECSLEAFDAYWYESYSRTNYVPTEDDVSDFIEAFGGFQADPNE